MMKTISIRLLLLLLGLSAGMVSCIHDDTTGFVKEISEITITKVSGEGVDENGMYAVAEFMMPVHIEAEAEQTMEGYELLYEWKAGFIKGYQDEKPQMDSLYLISDSKILEYSFDRVGEFLVRLRVYNEFGSTFYYMMVEVKAGMERGLLVLSSDDAGKGSLTFCSVEREAKELLQAKAEDFEQDAWARINPDYELTDVRDMVVMDYGKSKNSVFVLSESQQCMYELDQNSMLVLRKIDLAASQKDIKPIAMVPCRQNMAVMTKSGYVGCAQLESHGWLDDRWGTEMKGVKLYRSVIWFDWDKMNVSLPISADNENEKMVCYGNLGNWTDSGNDFQGRRIINFALVGATNNRNLLVVSESQNNPDKVWITTYNSVTDIDDWWNMFSKDGQYQEREYSLSAPLTLDIQSEMVYNGQYNVMFYNNGSTIYRWRYTSGFSDSNQASLPGNGEITCMAESPDGEYLYVGAYDATAAGLKGSIYIYATKDLQLVKSFIGITDKPLKLFYKDKN